MEYFSVIILPDWQAHARIVLLCGQSMNRRLLNLLIPEKPKDRNRLIIDVVLIAVLLGAYRWYTHWMPSLDIQSEHYIALSNASVEQTQDALDKAELLFRTYCSFWDISEPGDPLRLKIYASRKEFKRYNPMSGWAEAFYKKPYCHQYIETESADNPYHWMMHEATHQLNAEVAQFKLPQWADEGIACYFSTAQIVDHNLVLGEIDTDTYPIWWLNSLELTGDLAQDLHNNKVMSVKSIVCHEKPLKMNDHVNLYYVHWFSLVHFLLEGGQGKYKRAFIQAVQTPSGLKAFEQNVGSYKEIEQAWYEHLLDLSYRY